MFFFRKVIVFIVIIAFVSVTVFPVIAASEWMVISTGTIQGQGMDNERSDAIHECQDDMEQQYLTAVNDCCEGEATDFIGAVYTGRCDVHDSGSENKRSFSCRNSYFCWPSGTIQEFPETGYWHVADEAAWEC